MLVNPQPLDRDTAQHQLCLRCLQGNDDWRNLILKTDTPPAGLHDSRPDDVRVQGRLTCTTPQYALKQP